MANIHYLTPTASSETTNWSASHHLAVDDPPGSPDDAATAANSTNTSATCRMRVSLSTMAPASSVNRITLRTRIIGQAGQGAGVEVKPFVYVNSTRYYGASVIAPNSAIYVNHDDEWTENPDTSEPWTEDDLNNLEAGVEYIPTSDAQDSVFVTQLYVAADYVAAPAKIGPARDVASRYLLTFRRPTSIVEVVAPLRWADVEIGDTILLSHFAGETPDDAGWGKEMDERRLFVVMASDLNLDDMNVTLRLFDLRDFLTTFWDTAISEEAPGEFSQGVARLDTGATRTFARASDAYVENAAAAAQGSAEVKELTDDVEKQDTLGLLIESSGANLQAQSSFINGETGWGSTGEGSNGSLIQLDTTDLLFDIALGADSFEFTAGNPIHVADLQITGIATSSITASTTVRASFDHKDDNGAPLHYFIYRGTDSGYWRDSDSSWQATKTWNAMTAATTIHRHISNRIDVGTSATTLQAGIGIHTSGTPGQVNHLYHVQIEPNGYATSRIVSASSTSATRAADNLSIQNDHGMRVWPIEQGTGFLQFIPEWDTADLVSGAAPRLMVARFDASNLERVFYNQATGAFVYQRRVAGVNYSASFVQTTVRGTVYDIAWRWCGAEGEHGLDPYTLSVFVDGVKGTDVVAVPFGSVTAGAFLYIGQTDSNTEQANGFFRHSRITPLVLSDEEIADLP